MQWRNGSTTCAGGDDRVSDSLKEKVRYILDDSDFNDLPFNERKKICKYMSEQQILTLYQTLLKDREHTTEAWRKKQRAWLKNCVESYYREYRYPQNQEGGTIETNIFDEVEIYENCSVQILRNSVTGEESVGWWVNE